MKQSSNKHVNELTKKIETLMSELNTEKSKINSIHKEKMDNEAKVLKYLEENAKLQCDIYKIE